MAAVKIPLSGGGSGNSAIEANVAGITSFDLMVTAANASPASTFTHTLSDDVVISAAKTVPANLLFRPVNGGKFSISGAGTLTFAGVGIVGDPQFELFSGAAPGDVTWTGAIPNTFYPEWFGAVGDGTTDDLNAFDCVVFAVPDAISTGNSAVRMVLNSAKHYKLSASWHIDSKIAVMSDSQSLSARITFPANTIGIIVHYVATKTGSDNGRNSYRPQFRNLNINGSTGYQVATPSTHTVSVTAGFTVTKTAGDDFVIANGYAIGNTITINGYPYVIEAVNSTTVLTIREPVFIAWGTNGSPNLHTIAGVNLPTTDWVGRNIEINGATYVISSVTGDDIVLTTNFVGATTSTPYDAFLTNGIGDLTGVSARVNRFHGFDIRGSVVIERCRVTNFAGNGFSLGNSLTQGISGTSPNANNSYLASNEALYNAGSGYVTAGHNSAQSLFINNDSTANAGYGFLEMGGSGNNYLGNHSSFNFTGSTYCTIDGINKSLFLGEYTEGGSVSSTFGQYNFMLGGTHGAGFSKDSKGTYLANTSGVMSAKNLRVTKMIAPQPNLATKVWAFGIGDIAYDKWMASFGAAEEDANIYAGGSATNWQFPAYNFSYDDFFYAGWYIWHYKTTSVGGIDNPVYGVSGSAASEGGGKLAFFAGFRTGKTDPHVTRILKTDAALNFGSIAAHTTAELTITVTGAAAGDSVEVTPAVAPEAGLVWSGFVSAANTVTVRLLNGTTGAIDPASITWRAVVTKFA